MFRILFCVLVVACFTFNTQVAEAKNQTKLMSTEGGYVDSNIAKSKTPNDIKKDQKEKKLSAKKYIKNKKEIQKQNYKKIGKEKELEILEMRLEDKKMKLESLTLTKDNEGG